MCSCAGLDRILLMLSVLIDSKGQCGLQFKAQHQPCSTGFPPCYSTKGSAQGATCHHWANSPAQSNKPLASRQTLAFQHGRTLVTAQTCLLQLRIAANIYSFSCIHIKFASRSVSPAATFASCLQGEVLLQYAGLCAQNPRS